MLHAFLLRDVIMKKLRIYIDTSIVGGCLDEEFKRESLALIEMGKKGQCQLLLSELLFRELEAAPKAVKDVVAGLPEDQIEGVMLNEEAEVLRRAYLDAEVVGPAQGNDALHVAIASVAKADMIVSWNFRHIVHFDKIRGFNAVNLREGYLPLEIRSPREVV